MKGETKFGNLKFPYHRGIPSYQIPKLIDGSKKRKEFIIAHLLANRLLFHENRDVQKIEINPDDSNKKPDILINVDNKEIGIQITQISFTEYVKRKKLAIKKSFEIVDELLKILPSLPFKLNIYLHPPNLDDNWIPSNKKIINNKLIIELADIISSNINNISQPREKKIINVTDLVLKKNVGTITLEHVPDEFNSEFPGKNNIFVNYEFDYVRFSTKDIRDEVQKLYERKNEGKSSILLIWADNFEIRNKGELIAEEIKKVFSKSTFEEIYFIFFDNRKDIFFETLKIGKLK